MRHLRTGVRLSPLSQAVMHEDPIWVNFELYAESSEGLDLRETTVVVLILICGIT
jgi:hypothetical protein